MKAVTDGMFQNTTKPGSINQGLQQVCNNHKQKGGEGVSLPDTSFAVEGLTWDPIKKNRGRTTAQEILYPTCLFFWKSFMFQYFQDSLMLHFIKGFLKVKLEDDNFFFRVMAQMEELKGPSQAVLDGSDAQDQGSHSATFVRES